ncbi:MAG: type VI secretion system baseplate subunit TssG [Azoarcus sp.]|nr:type VI secretion system baseplate subunit TssG [Azoarcus sp.]
MQTAQRQLNPGLIGQLLETPWSFEFFQAVRVLARELDPVPRRESELPPLLRFSNSLRLGFAPSQLESASAIKVEQPAHADGEPLRGIELTPSFIGLLGIHGSLPAHYTEQVVESRRQARDTGAHAFFDLFSNRAVAQFYLAWRKYKLALMYEHDRRKHFVPQVLALCGLGQDELRDRLSEAPGAIDDESLAHFAALIRQRPVSGGSLQRVLSSYFGVPVRLEQFVGRWYRVEGPQLARLGQANVQLGTDVLLGERIWQCDLRVRVFLGPLSLTAYRAFLPGSDRAAALEKLLRLLTGLRLEYEIHPVLRAAEVASCQLTHVSASRLGFDSFLCSRPATSDRCDAAFDIHPS